MTTPDRDNQTTRGRGAAEVIVCLHHRQDGYRMVVAKTGREFAVLEARPVPHGDRAAIVSAVTRYGASRLLRVLPGSHAVCRVVPTPPSTPEMQLDALNLLAEAELPETLGSHRRAAGLLPGATGQSLLSGWVMADAPAPIGETPETFIAVPAALSALIAAGGAALYADRADGSICFATIGERGITVGAAMEDNATDESWGGAVGARLARCALPAGAARAEHLALDEETRARLSQRTEGARSDGQWLGEYGVALGAVIIAGAADPAMRSHAVMTAVAPKLREQPPVKVVRALSVPRTAWSVIGASLLVVLGGPYLFETLRLSMLTSRTAQLDSSKEGRDTLRKRAALFAQLDNPKSGRLPMTKLLHDISRVAPVGVTVPSVRISPEQGLSLQGTADKDELVNVYQANLTNTKQFANVKLNRKESSANGVEFDISADIVQPHLPVGGEDFAKEPIAVRLYGAGAVNTAVAKPAPDRRADRPSRRENGGGTEQNGASGSRRPSAPETTTPPAALSAAEIGKLDRPGIMKEFASRRAYVQKNPGLDAATKQRLEEEVTALRAKLEGGGR